MYFSVEISLHGLLNVLRMRIVYFPASLIVARENGIILRERKWPERRHLAVSSTVNIMSYPDSKGLSRLNRIKFLI